MKAIMVMFDSLNRHMLPPYGCDWVVAPNFARLAEQSVTFDRCYVGSMPCIPARRELHTGRYNFLHRSWGPLEPYDNSLPELLKQDGIYTHLATDHQHYWEDGGCTYHHRYNTWFFARGQEGDCWKAQVADPVIPETPKRRLPKPWRQDWVNRGFITKETDFPQDRTFANGIEFIRTNAQADNWFLQIETFDPHEPYFTPQRFKDLYPHDYDGPHFDWPDYLDVCEPPEMVQHLRYEYAALVSMCDEHLGKILDLMDELSLWDDTMLIVNTDHGFLLSEHDLWAKNFQPLYNEIAHIPLFIWDPRAGRRAERRESLVQTIDLAPTLLEYFGVAIPPDMQGRPLLDTIRSDRPVREAALFGYHGCHVNITDGRYIYMRGPANPQNAPLFEYTLMPTHIKSPFAVAELQDLELAEPFAFTKGCKTMKIPGLGSLGSLNPYVWGSLLFDLESDPAQEHPILDESVELRLLNQMVALMRQTDAPSDQYMRLGLPLSGPVGSEHLWRAQTNPPSGRMGELNEDEIAGVRVTWHGSGKKMYYGLSGLIPFWFRRQFASEFAQALLASGQDRLDEALVQELALQVAPRQVVEQMRLMSGVIARRS